jgi:hypothetical protein
LAQNDALKYVKAILGSVALFVLLDILISVSIPDRLMNVVFVVVASLVILGILLVAFGTATRNRWGINPESMNCPACGSPDLREANIEGHPGVSARQA